MVILAVSSNLVLVELEAVEELVSAYRNGGGKLLRMYQRLRVFFFQKSNNNLRRCLYKVLTHGLIYIRK